MDLSLPSHTTPRSRRCVAFVPALPNSLGLNYGTKQMRAHSDNRHCALRLFQTHTYGRMNTNTPPSPKRKTHRYPRIFWYVLRVEDNAMSPLIPRERHNVPATASLLHVKTAAEAHMNDNAARVSAGWLIGDVLCRPGQLTSRRCVIYPFFPITSAFLLQRESGRCNCLPGICLHYRA